MSPDGWYQTLRIEWRKIGMADRDMDVPSMPCVDGSCLVLCQLWRHISVRHVLGQDDPAPADKERWVPVPASED